MATCPCKLNRVVCWMFHGEPTWAWWAYFVALQVLAIAVVQQIMFFMIGGE